MLTDLKKLTPRQVEIVRLLSLGLTNREIADRCGIVEQSVKNQLVTIYLKLGVRNRTEALLKAKKILHERS